MPDWVLIMNESHRYRASSGVRAINELKPLLGLELTATPFTEGPKGAVPFKKLIVIATNIVELNKFPDGASCLGLAIFYYQLALIRDRLGHDPIF